MIKNNKKRLFEMFGYLDKTFKPTLSESLKASQFTITTPSGEITVQLKIGTYKKTNTLAVQLMELNGEIFATVSTNLPESTTLPKGEFFLKDWGENKSIAAELIKKNIILPTDNQVESGFITAKSYRINPKYLYQEPS
jgi:hypothetical protein